jgi:hypothetical protein
MLRSPFLRAEPIGGMGIVFLVTYPVALLIVSRYLFRLR